MKSMLPYFFFFIIMLSSLLGTNIIPMPDLMKPNQIRADAEQLYITDQHYVYIFSLSDYSLIKKIGRKGEGPGEFLSPPKGVEIIVLDNQLMINSVGKISYFSKSGEFKGETKVKAFMGGGLFPVADKLVGIGFGKENNRICYQLNMFDSALDKKIKNIHSIDAYYQKGKPINPILAPRRPFLWTTKDHIFIEDHGRDIHVFDSMGNKKRVIHLDYAKVKFTAKRKEKYMEYFNGPMKQEWQILKRQAKFPQYFPNIRHFLIANQKIVIITFKEDDTGNKKELLTLDLNGKRINTFFIKLEEVNPLRLVPFSVYNNRLYQLVENDQSEMWELQVSKIQ
jgi:hypothetical protein